ncbi:MAG: M23 family metallopeptidase, partial [Candidatus Latescibacteria bacterium]|nr:M23 family metallopeptidase [Candidatus Latescibacterota bacterium]
MIRRFVAAAGLLLWAGVGTGGTGEYDWPMAVKPALTSTFGEYRPGRFHAGLDLKTWGKEGFPVIAVSNGYVSRIRTSPWGYGRVVYLVLDDGRTAVYAHLSRFAPGLATLVESEQQRKGTYSVNLFLEPGQVSVARGETVGYSGSSGTGVPHLHFELRDASQRPMNPLLNGFQVRDTLSPTIKSLALVPLNAEARVAGGTEPRVIGVRWNRKRKRYLTSQEVDIEGAVGVAVEVYDRADASRLSNRLAAHRLKLLVDGEEVFQTGYDAFSYDQIHQVELDRNFRLRVEGSGRYHNLFRSPGNGLPLYGRYRVGDGVLHAGRSTPRAGAALPPGRHVLRVVVSDAAGNRSEARLSVRAVRFPDVPEASAAASGDSVRVTGRAEGSGTLDLAFESSADGGKTWRSEGRIQAASGEGAALSLPGRQGGLYRVRVRDGEGLQAYRTCAPFRPAVGAAVDSMLVCTSTFYRDYAAIRVEADRVLAAAPRLRARWDGGREAELHVRQRALRSYEAVLVFDPNEKGKVRITASAIGLGGEAGHQTTIAEQQPVEVSGGAVRSGDGMAEARFDSAGVYERLFGRVFVAGVPRDVPAAGLAYRFSPGGIPFNRRDRAIVSLRHPAGFERPERL